MTLLLASLLKPPCCLSAGTDGTVPALIASLNAATLLMLAVPFVLVTTGTIWLWRAGRGTPTEEHPCLDALPPSP